MKRAPCQLPLATFYLLLFIFILLLACGPLASVTPTRTVPLTPSPTLPRAVVIVIPSPTSAQLPTSTLRPAGAPTPAPSPLPTALNGRQPTATLTSAPTVPGATPIWSPTAFGTPQPQISPTATGLPATETPTATATSPEQPIITPTVTTQPASPSPSPLPSPTPPPVLGNLPLIPPAGVQVYSTTITIPTYDYQQALYVPDMSDPVYPYHRLDFARLGMVAPRVYQAVALENAYVKVIILPELGGRVYSWLDKTTNRAIAYSNPVIKPVEEWGYRGWWLATGGIEWCLPTDEHGLNEYRPWRTARTGASVTVSDREDRTGLDVQVTLSLDSVHNYLTIQPRIANNTGSTQRFKFWLNAMLAFANNRVSNETRFIMPSGQATIHSTGDPGLPAEGVLSWPVYNGRDISVVGNLNGWLGVFARPQAAADFAGAYDAASDMGIVRAFPADVARGVKFFTPRGLDSNLWTDDGSNYFELWGGLAPTFADQATLGNGQSVSWTERWYPVSGLGGSYDYASAAAAIRLTNRAESVTINLVASSNLEAARIRLWQNRQMVAEWLTSLGPGRPISASWQRPAASCTGEACAVLGVQLLDAGGQMVAQMGVIGP